MSKIDFLKLVDVWGEVLKDCSHWRLDEDDPYDRPHCALTGRDCLPWTCPIVKRRLKNDR